jgi:hypothetical protein
MTDDERRLLELLTRDRKLIMDYYESVVVNYIRADRALFVNTECCIQLNKSDNPDTSGPHWYCDAVACDFRNRRVLRCEISYSAQLSDLSKRLKGWHDNWDSVCQALVRDSFVPKDWPARPWLFVPQKRVPVLLKRFEQMSGVGLPLNFKPLITPLEMVQPWLYRWSRIGEEPKPGVPAEMQA